MPAEGLKFTHAEVAAYYAQRIPDLKQSDYVEWRGRCPLHDGDDDNFAVNPRNGLWFCHSRCGRGGSIFDLEMALSETDFKTAKAEVFRIVGRTTRSVAAEVAKRGKSPNVLKRFRRLLRQRIHTYAEKNDLRHVSTYHYKYEDGSLAFVKAKFRDAEGEKTFLKYAPTPEGGLTTPSRAGIPPMLYNLHLLADADEIHLCNGEKAAIAGRKLGLVTTCLPDGEANWNGSFTPLFEGKRVVAHLDNDVKGEEHGIVVASALFDRALEIRLVRLPDLPAKGDFYDWIKAGGTVKQLRTIIDSTAVVDTKPNAPANSKARKSLGPPDSAAFRLTDDSVLYVDPGPDREPMRICGRLEVLAFTRDAKGNSWGRLLKWTDAEGLLHEWAMPMSLLSGDGGEYRARLLDGGLFLAPGRKARELLTVYIQTAQSDARALCVSRVGWQGDNFVLPGAAVGPARAGAILFQPAHESEHFLNVSGTAEEWRKYVGRLCSGNSRLILAVSCAFAGPILSMMETESGGVHLIGPSSTGKSTALIVGGSVLGGGGINGFVQSWRATANGLEATAESHNDLTLYIDELGQLDPREASEIAYHLANGRGKQRMNRNTGPRRTPTWLLMIMSSGEVTLRDHAQTAGKLTRGGAEVRLVNVVTDAGAGLGLFENIHGAKSADIFARKLRRLGLRYYGAPLRAWLDYLTKDRVAAQDALKQSRSAFLNKYLPASATGEVSRAAQRFALIGAAGEIATTAGITGWANGESLDAAGRCFQGWLDNRGTKGGTDAESAIQQVRRFLEAHGASRFQGLVPYSRAHAAERIVNRAGFLRNRNGENQYLILPETFKKEVCSGFDYQTVARELRARGFLVCEPPDLTVKPNLPGIGRSRVYCVRASILKSDD